jgi:hypothetical protein
MTTLVEGALLGAAAGAAGTTVLDSVTYLDMTFRARPASHTPEATVERLAQDLHLAVPGDAAKRKNRIEGLAPLTGIAAGVGMGAVLGMARAAGWRPPHAVSYAAAAVGALIGTNGPMTALKVTDPRTWTAKDWVADIVPHLAYAVLTVSVLRRLED